jgi:hypothetical protein
VDALPPSHSAGIDGKIAPAGLERIHLQGMYHFPVDRYADQILPSQGALTTGPDRLHALLPRLR